MQLNQHMSTFFRTQPSFWIWDFVCDLVIQAGVVMSKPYDLEERTAMFAKCVRDFVRRLPKDLTNLEYSRQLTRASASVGANYIEANESLSKKDFLMRIKISRKEAKETRYWLQLIIPGEVQKEVQEQLSQEATELLMIFTAILRKSQGSVK